jgi:phage/plasmid-associated DNA primase
VWGGDKSAEGELKRMITEDTILIEPKGYDRYEISNHIRLLLSSNNDWIVPAGPEERRFMVVDVSPARIGDFKYFAAIEKQMQNGGLEAFMHYLLNFDLHGINLRQIPRTLALQDQIEASLSSFEKFWFDRLNSGVLFELARDKWDPYNNSRSFTSYYDDWPESFQVKELFSEYQDYCKTLNIRHRVTQSQVGKNLRNLCKPLKKERVLETKGWMVGEKRRRLVFYNIPSLEKCREDFERSINIKINWEGI